VLVAGRSVPKESFARQLMYFADELGDFDRAAEAQQRLRNAAVAVVGCGGLGSWTVAALACAGVGTLILVDDDVVELSNLNRQVLFRTADLGRPKVEAAAEALRAFAPDLELRALRLRIASAAGAASALAGADVVVETADWPPYELSRWIDGACLELGAAHIGAAQQPPLIRVGPLRVPGVSQCHGCWEDPVRRRFPLYDALAAQRARRARPAATVGFAAAAVGGVVAAEVVHLLSGVAEPATLRGAWLFDMQTLETRREACDLEPCGCGQLAGRRPRLGGDDGRSNSSIASSTRLSTSSSPSMRRPAVSE
jgi:hypothetical protein